MLMNIATSVVQSLKIELTFDNSKVKVREISQGDLIHLEYNDYGKRRVIDGKVLKICTSLTTNVDQWYFIVDGSLDYNSERVRVCPNHVLDIEIIQKHDAICYVATPNDSTRITNIRLRDNRVLEISNDNGYTWIEMVRLFSEDDLPYPPLPPTIEEINESLNRVIKQLKSTDDKLAAVEKAVEELHEIDIEVEPEEPPKEEPSTPEEMMTKLLETVNSIGDRMSALEDKVGEYHKAVEETAPPKEDAGTGEDTTGSFETGSSDNIVSE